MDLLILGGVFLLAFFAMFIGALSGGVGLITRPILILLGYSPNIVVGTSRASSIPGELPGIVVLYKRNKTSKKMILLAIPMMIGTLGAAAFTITAESNVLETVIGVIVFTMALCLLFKSKFDMAETKAKFSYPVREAISFIGSTVLAFLSTLSGGLGILYSTFYVWLYGKSYLEASAMWRVASYIGGLVSSIIFIIKGIIDWQLFVALSLGFMLGSYFGTNFALKKGEAWIKYVIVGIAILSSLKLLLS